MTSYVVMEQYTAQREVASVEAANVEDALNQAFEIMRDNPRFEGVEKSALLAIELP